MIKIQTERILQKLTFNLKHKKVYHNIIFVKGVKPPMIPYKITKSYQTSHVTTEMNLNKLFKLNISNLTLDIQIKDTVFENNQFKRYQ